MKLSDTPKSVSDARRRLEEAERAFNEAMVAARRDGHTLRQIAVPAHVAPETVRKIVNT